MRTVKKQMDYVEDSVLGFFAKERERKGAKFLSLDDVEKKINIDRRAGKHNHVPISPRHIQKNAR